jgi:hypothetical protein
LEIDILGYHQFNYLQAKIFAQKLKQSSQMTIESLEKGVLYQVSRLKYSIDETENVSKLTKELN